MALISGVLVLFSFALLSTKLLRYSRYLYRRGWAISFLVDTGAQMTVIDPELAKHLHLKIGVRVEMITNNSSAFRRA
jgi:hypothetical protein